MLGAAEILAPVITAGELDVKNLPCLEAVETAVEDNVQPMDFDVLAGFKLEHTAADDIGHARSGCVPAIGLVAAALDDIGDQVFKVDALLHGLRSLSGFSPKDSNEVLKRVFFVARVLVWVLSHCVEPR